VYINKIGSYHTEIGTNNQDCGFDFKKFNCVVDGCSEGEHSEIGAKLFTKRLRDFLILRDKFADKYSQTRIGKVGVYEIVKIFEDLLEFVAPTNQIYDKYLSDIHNNMLFTILFLQEDAWGWDFYICGDGFVITQDHNDVIKFHDIDHAPAPMYLAYSYVKPESLALSDEEKSYLKQTPFKVFRYYKKEYKSVGIASDGIAYIAGTEQEDKFKELFPKKKDFLIKRFINQMNNDIRKVGGSGFFKDDITISMR